MKKYLVSLSVIAFLTGCRNNHGKTRDYSIINGRVTGAQAGEIIYRITTGFENNAPLFKDDTVKFTDGRFRIVDSIDNGAIRRIFLPGEPNPPFMFVVDPGVQQIELRMDTLWKSVITGSKNDELSRQIRNSMAALEERLRDEMAPVSKKLQAEPENRELLRESIKIERNYRARRIELFADFIEKNPDSPVGAFLIFGGRIEDFKDLSDLYRLLGKPAQGCVYGQRIKEQLDRLAKLQPGKQAPRFSLETPDKKQVSLKDYSGMYVLIDFWSSWCKPCRRENQVLKRLYEKYHKAGFEIIGISLDEPQYREKWLKAIRDDALPWIQVNDPKGFLGKTAKRYAVKRIPHQALIDKAGKIVSTFAGAGDEASIADELAEIFNDEI